MDTPGWLIGRRTDVPPGDEWLGENEREVLAGLRIERRRGDWRLGRWTAKAALRRWLGLLGWPPERIEVLAAADGAPEAWVDGYRAPVSISLSHRAGRALAVIEAAPGAVGCDLEVVEPRSGAFVRDWLAPSEQRLVNERDESERALLANLIWTAKEAAAKVRREGLRLDVRSAVVTLSDGAATTRGWWRAEPGWVMTIAGEPGTAAPRELVRRSNGID
jgi:4'-phosphopantetheinyl transferase